MGWGFESWTSGLLHAAAILQAAPAPCGALALRLYRSRFGLASSPSGLRAAPLGARRELSALALPRRPTGSAGAMVPSPAKPGSAQGTSETESLGPAPTGAAPLPGLGPSDGPEAAAENVEVELAGPAGAEPPQPPEGGWGWLVMLTAMWCNGSVFGIQNACGVLFVSMLDTFGSKDDAQMVFKTGEAQRPLRPAPGDSRAFPPRTHSACQVWVHARVCFSEGPYVLRCMGTSLTGGGRSVLNTESTGGSQIRD